MTAEDLQKLHDQVMESHQFHTAEFDHRMMLKAIVLADLALRAKTVIEYCAAKETGDPNHDWTTCNQPSCFMARQWLQDFGSLS